MTHQPPDTAVTHRMGVPEMFGDRRFEQVLILSFGADVEFYERVLRRHFGHYRNQIVLADSSQLSRAVAAAGSLRQLNKSWLAGPIRTEHAAHAKAILLAGPDAGLLLVGSGNLSVSGYAGLGECFTAYRWAANESDHLTAFSAVRDLTDGLVARSCLDTVTDDRLAAFWSAYHWWHAPPVDNGPVRHNLTAPLGEQFVSAINGEDVRRLTVVAPFHDRHCAALDRLAHELRPRELRVLVQPRHCSVDPQRLAAVLSAHAGQAYSLTAAGDERNTYLHAKIIVAVTDHRAICLTGSANSSMVALWVRYPSGNIELGNLTSGPPHAFDHLFDPALVTISGPVEPASLAVAIKDDCDDQVDHVIHVAELSWKAPFVSCVISVAVVDPADIVLNVDGRPAPAIVALTPHREGWTYLTAELTAQPDIDAVEEVAVITIRVGDHSSPPTVPYQVERLKEQAGRRVDAERLRHAAQLELDDPDLEQALAALEEILVGENVARWTHSRGNPGSDTEPDASTIDWADIDWRAVRRDPVYSGYGSGSTLSATGSDLAVYLEALTRSVRALTEPAQVDDDRTSATHADHDDLDETDTSDITAGLDGAEVDDVAEDPRNDPPSKRQSAAVRNRRLIGNFIRRNLRALEQPSFRDGAGAGVTILNIIILNWMCWWVATRGDQPAAALADERLRLWRLLWGDSETPAYLDQVDEETQLHVLDRFENQRFEAVTVASMINIWTRTDKGADPRAVQLRNILRHAVSHPTWQVTPSQLRQAAGLVNGRQATSTIWNPYSVIDALRRIAAPPLGDTELREIIAKILDVAPQGIELRDQTVIVDQTRTPRRVREALLTKNDLTTSTVEEILAAWQGIEDRPHYRLKWSNGIAQYNALTRHGWIYRTPKDDQTDLDTIQPSRPQWQIQLDSLHQAVLRATRVSA
jgi:hypothetical protein